MRKLIILIALVSFSLVTNAQNVPVMLHITANNVNVRAKPSVNAPLVEPCGDWIWKINKGFEFYQEPINGWYPVNFYIGCERSGYISGKFVEVVYAFPLPEQLFREKGITTTSGLTLKITKLDDNECLINTTKEDLSGKITYYNYLGRADKYQINLSHCDDFDLEDVGCKFLWKKGEKGFDEAIMKIRNKDIYEPGAAECLFWDPNKQKLFFSGNYYDLE